MAELELRAELAKLLEQRVHLACLSTSSGTLPGRQPGFRSEGLRCLLLHLSEISGSMGGDKGRGPVGLRGVGHFLKLLFQFLKTLCVSQCLENIYLETKSEEKFPHEPDHDFRATLADTSVYVLP